MHPDPFVRQSHEIEHRRTFIVGAARGRVDLQAHARANYPSAGIDEVAINTRSMVGVFLDNCIMAGWSETSFLSGRNWCVNRKLITGVNICPLPRQRDEDG